MNRYKLLISFRSAYSRQLWIQFFLINQSIHIIKIWHNSQKLSHFVALQKSMNKYVKMKICIVGPQGSGKTAFIRNLCQGEFIKDYESTQNYEITIYELKNSGTSYQVQLWQCGAKHFTFNKYLRKAFFHNSSATFIMFDLCDLNWKQSMVKWIQQSYNFQSFLVYAIGTKKDILDIKNLNRKTQNLKNKISLVSEGDQNQEQLQYEYQYKNNVFFDLYQVRHFYQNATQKIAFQIKNIFVSINDDRQKLTRSSLARGTKFDNSLLESYMSKMKMAQSIGNLSPSIKVQQIQKIQEDQSQKNDSLVRSSQYRQQKQSQN